MKRGDLLLTVILVVALAVWLSQKSDEIKDNPVTVVTENGTVENDTSTTAGSATFTERVRDLVNPSGGEKEITQHVSRSTGGFSGLPITTYNLQAPLLPAARLLDFRKFNNRLWFAGNTGLYSFDLTSERWFVKTPEHGLPRDTAYGIESTKNGLLLELLDWNEKGHLTNNRRVEFDGETFTDTHLTKITAQTGDRMMPDRKPLKGSVSEYQRTGDVDWYCVRGKHAGRDVGFKKGGVIKFNSQTSAKTIFTKKDGLLKDYCTSITAASDESMWVSHWDEEVGLSYLPPNSKQWHVKANSANGIPLGGPSVHAHGDFLFIAQQRALVIYHPASDMAIDITEELGLSGFIVTDVQATADGRIWATSYRYQRGGKGQAASGLISFELSDVERLFAPENLEQTLWQVRKL